MACLIDELLKRSGTARWIPFKFREKRLLTVQSLLCEKCPNTEFFLVRTLPVFGLNTGYLLRKSPYSVQISENTDQKKNSVFGHFSRSGWQRSI